MLKLHISSIKDIIFSIIHKIGDNIYSLMISALVGSTITIVTFFLTSNKNSYEEKKEIINQIVNRSMRDKHKNLTNMEISYTDSFKTSILSETIIVTGKFSLPEFNTENNIRNDSIFMAFLGEGNKTLIDAIVGRNAALRLESAVIFHGIGDSRRFEGIRVDDSFNVGEKAIVFDIIEEYANSRAISPVIFHKINGKWHPILIKNFNDEAQKVYAEATDNKTIRPRKDELEWIKESKKDDGNIVYTEKWEINVDGQKHEMHALRNSSGYKYIAHLRFGYKQIIVVASYQDGPNLSPHRVFVKIMKLKKKGDSFEWFGDETWNGGKTIISNRLLNYKSIDFEKLYEQGITKVGDADFWGASFGKERRMRQ